MPTATGRQSISFAGLNQYFDFEVFGDAETLLQPLAPIAHQATAWTKATSSTGTATLAKLHGITSGDKVDLYSDDGYVHGATATVTSGSTDDSIALSGGTGTYPDTDTEVILGLQVGVSVEFVASVLKALVATVNDRCVIVFTDSEAAEHAFELLSTQGLLWMDGSLFTNPLTGLTIASATISTADIVGVDTDPETETANAGCIVNLGLLYDATT